MKGQCVKCIVVKLYKSVPEERFVATVTVDAVQIGVTKDLPCEDAAIATAALMTMKGYNDKARQDQRIASAKN